MAVVWTSHLHCFNCGREFILNRVSLSEVTTAKAVFVCPHCGAKPSFFRPHKLAYLYVANLPYRRTRDGDSWHYSEYCSNWPLEDFIEIDFPPTAEICNECKAIVGNESG